MAPARGAATSIKNASTAMARSTDGAYQTRPHASLHGRVFPILASMNFAVLVFPGTWSERDCQYVLSHEMGQTADLVWHRESSLEGYDAVVIPGGSVVVGVSGWGKKRWVATYRLFWDAYTVRPSATKRERGTT